MGKNFTDTALSDTLKKGFYYSKTGAGICGFFPDRISAALATKALMDRRVKGEGIVGEKTIKGCTEVLGWDEKQMGKVLERHGIPLFLNQQAALAAWEEQKFQKLREQ